MSAESNLMSFKNHLRYFEDTLHRIWIGEETLYHRRAIEKQSENIDEIIRSISNLHRSIMAAERDIQREAEQRMKSIKK